MPLIHANGLKTTKHHCMMCACNISKHWMAVAQRYMNHLLRHFWRSCIFLCNVGFFTLCKCVHTIHAQANSTFVWVLCDNSCTKWHILCGTLWCMSIKKQTKNHHVSCKQGQATAVQILSFIHAHIIITVNFSNYKG